MPSDVPNLDCEVAVIIPTYNCAASLAEAIESVLAQTYRAFRIFVIDDGSTDATPQVLQPYSDRCVCLWQPNAGAAAARNRGILESSSKYIAFLDADDLWHRSKLERQVDLLNRNPEVGLVCSDFAMVSATQHVGSQFARSRVPEDGRVFAHLLQDCFVSTPCVVLRRQALDEVGIFNESLTVCEDMNLWLRIASRWKIAAIREVLVTVRRRSESLSANASGTRLPMTAGLTSLQHIQASCLTLTQSEQRALRRALAVYYYQSGSTQLIDGFRRPARAHLIIAIRYMPSHLRAMAKLCSSLLPASVFRSLMRLFHTIRR
jgi:glycosyltransferase involved in cell wall biosynthesis